jgi:hypothetical protein
MPAEDYSWTSFVNVVNDTTTMAGRAKVAEVLREEGIPGIRYLDGMSRKDGDGSYNYVIFDDNLIEIVAIDGQPVANLRAELADVERTQDSADLVQACKF